MGRGVAASKRARERIRFRKGGGGGMQGLKKKKNFWRVLFAGQLYLASRLLQDHELCSRNYSFRGLRWV